MFQIGEKIVYGNNGVCQVEDVTRLQMEGVDNQRLYYILVPLDKKRGKIYTPTDNEKIKMRRVLTKKEAEHLVDEIECISQLDIAANDKMREEKYKEILRTCDCHECIRLIKTIYIRKQNLISMGKKLPNTDEKYLRQAEDSLYSELSVALDIDKNGMVKYIEERVNAK
ncbi:MAG: CarD family transcriptional regulator [Lachnospiraceae bacterium]|nr:CarD family transcriptional regulator [Lachnospiraceae bacterium]